MIILSGCLGAPYNCARDAIGLGRGGHLKNLQETSAEARDGGAAPTHRGEQGIEAAAGGGKEVKQWWGFGPPG